MSSVERIRLAPDYSIPRVINGCWQLTPDHGGGPRTQRQALRIFAELVDHGFTTFDCADIYIGVEETLGKFRRSLVDPSRIQIHTKYVANADTLYELTSEDIDSAIDRSLQRLGVERLDMVQYHWWNYDVPGLGNLTDRMVRAQQAGKIRLLALTNFDTAHIREIAASGAQIVSVQAQYSLLDRRPEGQMTGLYEEKGIRLLPYGVLGGGFISEKYLGAAAPSEMNRSLQKYRLIIDEIGGWDAFQQLLETLSQIAKKHDSNIGAIAARWVLDQPAVAAIILGTGSKSRAKQNTLLSTLKLDEEDKQKISERLAKQKTPPGDMYHLERDAGGRHSKIIKKNLHDCDSNQ